MSFPDGWHRITAYEMYKWAENQPIQTKEATMTETTIVPTKPQARTVPLDDMAKDLENLEIVETMIAQALQRKEEIRDRIKKRLGEDGVGTLNGQPVFAYKVTAGFASSQFAKDHPQIAAQFTTAKVVEELNAGLLAAQMPELYQEYRVRQLKPVGSQK